MITIIKNIIILLILFNLSLMAESDISKAFLDGNIEGELQLLHYDIDRETDTDSYATALGGFLKYTTDTKNNFFASVRFNTSNPIGSNLNKMGTSMFNNDKEGSSLNVNSEAYLAYQNSDSIIKLGNIMINTPMMSIDTSRIVPWSYRGISYSNKFTDNIEVQLYHIGSIRSNIRDKYTKESASGEIGSSGISMLGVSYEGSNRLHIKSYYYYAPELYSTFVAQLDYTYLIDSNAMVCYSISYYNSGDGGKYVDRLNKNGGDDINLLALRTSIDTEDWLVSLNYSQNFGVSGIVKGYGGLAKVYTSSMIANGRANYKPETWMLKTTYTLPLKSHDSELALWLTNTKVHDNRGDGFNAYYLHFKHHFTGDTSIFLRYENINYTTMKSDVSYFRLIAKHRF